MQVHLVRCRKQHPTAQMEICPFNAIHHVPKQEYPYHVRHCEYRKTIEEQKYSLIVSAII